MRNKLLAGVLSVAATMGVAAPVFAADVVADFGSSRYSYGYGSGATGFQAAPAMSNCFNNAALSCYANDRNSVPTVVKNNSGTAQSIGTPTIPVGQLLLHPGTGSNEDSVIRYTNADATGIYTIAGAFSRLDTSSGSGNGVLASIFRVSGGVSTLLFSTAIGSTNYMANTFNANTLLNNGDQILFAVNNAGEYTYDSTGLRATITAAVPEPSTWAMMLLGFGAIGFSMRRRKPVAGRAYQLV